MHSTKMSIGLSGTINYNVVFESYPCRIRRRYKWYQSSEQKMSQLSID